MVQDVVQLIWQLMLFAIHCGMEQQTTLEKNMPGCDLRASLLAVCFPDGCDEI
jgi:hypothetical protein